jgi:hypothetical protein
VAAHALQTPQYKKKKKQTPWPLVRERTIPTERPQSTRMSKCSSNGAAKLSGLTTGSRKCTSRFVATVAGCINFLCSFSPLRLVPSCLPVSVWMCPIGYKNNETGGIFCIATNYRQAGSELYNIIPTEVALGCHVAPYSLMITRGFITAPHTLWNIFSATSGGKLPSGVVSSGDIKRSLDDELP